jgi:hypothetical protein
MKTPPDQGRRPDRGLGGRLTRCKQDSRQAPAVHNLGRSSVQIGVSHYHQASTLKLSRRTEFSGHSWLTDEAVLSKAGVAGDALSVDSGGDTVEDVFQPGLELPNAGRPCGRLRGHSTQMPDSGPC